MNENSSSSSISWTGTKQRVGFGGATKPAPYYIQSGKSTRSAFALSEKNQNEDISERFGGGWGIMVVGFLLDQRKPGSHSN